MMATKPDDIAKPQTAKPQPPKKRRGWLGLLLLVAVVAFAGAYLTTPAVREVANNAAAKAAVLVNEMVFADADTPADDTPPPPPITSTSPSGDSGLYAADATNANDGGGRVNDTNANVDIAAQLASVHRRLDLMAQNDDDNIRHRRQLQDRLYQLEQRAAGNDNNNHHIQLIDIALRATGNASAAADSLASLAAEVDTAEQRDALLAESRRLGNVPNRETITAAIGKLRGLLRDIADIAADDKPANAAAAVVFSLLKVQKITTASSRAKSLDDALSRMEWLIVVGRDEAYLQELRAAAAHWHNVKDSNDNGDIARLFGELQQMGAPRYKLAAGVAQ